MPEREPRWASPSEQDHLAAERRQDRASLRHAETSPGRHRRGRHWLRPSAAFRWFTSIEESFLSALQLPRLHGLKRSMLPGLARWPRSFCLTGVSETCGASDPNVRRCDVAEQVEADGLGSWARRRWTREVLLRYNAAHRSICFIVPSARSVMGLHGLTVDLKVFKLPVSFSL